MIKKYYLFIMLGILVIACKKDDDDLRKSDPLGNVIEEVTIGSEGGIITTNDFEVEIPANTWSTVVDLSISKSTDNAFGSDQISYTYFINNLPENTSEPITLRLKNVPETVDLKVFMAELNFVKSTQSQELVYKPSEYTVDGEDILVVLPAGNTLLKSAEANENSFSVGILAVSGYSSVVSSGGHFNISFPVANVEEAEELGDYLEYAFSLFSGSQFGFSYAERTSWPVEVTIKPLGNDVFGYMSASVLGNNYASLEFNSKKLSDAENLSLTAGHEFMHFVQNLYDPRNRFSKAKFAAPHLWLDEAVSVWVEEFFTENKPYTSTIRAGHQMAPFAGMLKGAEEEAAFHGYGMSGLIKYIANEYTSGSIKTIYENIYKNENSDKAIGLATNTDYSSWYGTFLQKYTIGELYSDVAVNTWIGNKSGEFNIRSSNDTIKEFSSSYAELAGKFYTISIDPDAVKDESALELSIKQGYNGKVCAFKYNASSFESIGYVSSSVTVSDIKSLAQSGYKILVLVSNLDNSFATNDENEMIFQVKVVNNNTQFTKISFSLNVMANIIRVYDGGSTSEYQSHIYYDLPEVPATQSGNVITASWDGVYFYQRKGTATITISGNAIVSFEINDFIENGSTTEIVQVSGTSMSLASESVFGLGFSIDNICNSLINYYSFKQYDGFSEESQDFYCDDFVNTSYINLRY